MFGKNSYLLDFIVFNNQFKIPRRSRCVGSSPTPATMGKSRIIKAISSVVKPPKGGFFMPEICFSEDTSEDEFSSNAYSISFFALQLPAPLLPSCHKLLSASNFYGRKLPVSLRGYPRDQRSLLLSDRGK